MDNDNLTTAMNHIITALRERGYNPYHQIYAYLKYDEPAYITKHDGARDLIQTLNKAQALEYVKIQLQK